VTSGRVFTAALLRAPQSASSTLVLCAHHLCVDMHSWYLILSALDAVNTVNGTSNSGLHCWNDYLASKTVDPATQENWRTVCQTLPPHFPPVSLPDDTLPRTRAWREDFRHPCVGRLFESCGDTAYSAETYVLAALALVLRYYSDEPWCRIEMEGMGRGGWPDEPDVADTVGWFTLFYPWAIPLHGDMATLLSAIAADLAKRMHGGGDYGLLQMRHAPEGSLAQGIRMNYIGVQAQPPLRHFHIDHLHSDIYTAPENTLGCVLEFNIARSAADGLSFHCRFDPTRIALNDVQLLLTRYKNSLTALDAWLCQHSATLTGAPTLWTL
ncbi:condensation domain-containing protein, partial [Erwinia oleae]